MEDCPLVVIEWEDSAQPIASWAFLSDFTEFEATRCKSVGWLIHDGDVKALAQNVGNPENSNSAQVSGVIRIPARCVVSITVLRKAT